MPIEARHVCILFRRFVSYGEDVTRPYVDALEARGIRHLLVGGRAFHDREEIETLRAALMAIEWPDDQLSVFATLRGALFAIGDEELLEYHHLRPAAFHPFRVPDDAAGAARSRSRDALDAAGARCTGSATAVPVADTISALLDATRAHVGFVLRPAASRRWPTCCTSPSWRGSTSSTAACRSAASSTTLQAEAPAGQAAEAPILEEGSDGVRLMTVHKAKGLEFPVVILADITARLTPYEAGRYIDTDARAVRAADRRLVAAGSATTAATTELRRERREGERVAYVAATRARDLLVVPAVGDEPYDGGLGVRR